MVICSDKRLAIRGSDKRSERAGAMQYFKLETYINAASRIGGGMLKLDIACEKTTCNIALDAMQNNTSIEKEVIRWLITFAQMVRNKDYAGAKSLFDDKIFGFGTIANSYSGIAEYLSLQWQKCWGATKDFDFSYYDIEFVLSADKTLVVVAVYWTSVGIGFDGTEFPRDGRASIVLRRTGSSGAWLAIHSHYSRTPTSFPQNF